MSCGQIFFSLTHVCMFSLICCIGTIIIIYFIYLFFLYYVFSQYLLCILSEIIEKSPIAEGKVVRVDAVAIGK